MTQGCRAPANRYEWSSNSTRYNGSSARWQTAVTLQGTPFWSKTRALGLMRRRVVHPDAVRTGVSLPRAAQPPLWDDWQSVAAACAGERSPEVWEGDGGN